MSSLVSDMFKSASLKLQRAEHHIIDLKRQFEAFVAEKPYRISVELNDNTGETYVFVRLTKNLPEPIALVTGDAIHNLRAALDHVAWRMVGIDQGVQNRHTKFQFGDNRINFEAACNGIKTPSQWVKDFFVATEAFPEGHGDGLYKLKCLNDADKHTVVTPIARATSHPEIKAVFPNGKVAAHLTRKFFWAGPTEAIPLLAVMGHDLRIELEGNTDCTPAIFLEEIPALVIPSLEKWAIDVARVIRDAESAGRKSVGGEPWL